MAHVSLGPVEMNLKPRVTWKEYVRRCVASSSTPLLSLVPCLLALQLGQRVDTIPIRMSSWRQSE